MRLLACHCIVFVAGVLANSLSASSYASAETPEVELEELLGTLPDKTQDVMTVTHRFRRDLLEFCRMRDCESKVAVEVGCYRGHTTALLSRLFRQVFALDHSGPNLAAARALNANRSNVIYLRVEIYSGAQHFGWADLLAENDIHMAFVDASHLYEHVVSDIHSALRLPLVETLVFDDYGLIEPVREAVDSYREAGMLECGAIGEDMEPLLHVQSIDEARRWWTNRGTNHAGTSSSFGASARAVVSREGLICDVVHRAPQPEWHRAVVGLHFGCYEIIIVGKAVPYLEFAFKLSQEHMEVYWPEPGRHAELVSWVSHTEYRLELQAEADLLAPDFIFGSKLRSGFFFRNGEPEHLCVVSEDMNWIHQWTREDVANALRGLEG